MYKVTKIKNYKVVDFYEYATWCLSECGEISPDLSKAEIEISHEIGTEFQKIEEKVRAKLSPFNVENIDEAIEAYKHRFY